LFGCVVVAACTPAEDPSGYTEAEKKASDSIAVECDQPRVRAVLVATTGEVNGSDSSYMDGEDTRAGTFEADFRFGCGPNPNSELATSRVTATLRSGAGTVVEQWLVNDPRPPHALNDHACNALQAYPQCWLFVPGDVEQDGTVTATVPKWSDGSNSDFDPFGSRPALSGKAALLLGNMEDDPVDGRVIVQWTAPKGIDTARLQLRIDRLTTEKGGLAADHFTLYRSRWYGDGPDVQSPVVEVLGETDRTLTLAVSVRDMVDFVEGADDDDGCVFPSRGVQVEDTTIRWTFANHGTSSATIDNLEVGWPQEQGALTRVRIDGALLWEGVREPTAVTFNQGWEAIDDERTVEPGEEVTIEMTYEVAPDAGWNPSLLAIDVGFAEGCATKFVPSPGEWDDFDVL
jgi:hypothetical protein